MIDYLQRREAKIKKQIEIRDQIIGKYKRQLKRELSKSNFPTN
jgi:hypothetical protein